LRIDISSAKKRVSHIFVDSRIIRPDKGRKKNLKPVKTKQFKNLDPLIVDSYQQAKKLIEELKELGVPHKMVIRSNHNTMRYSRVIS